jgi:heme/copper-type cytochrome/quinol oxidase subunit 2
VLKVGEPVQFKVTSADTRHTFVIESLGIEIEVPQKSLHETVTTRVVTPQAVGTLRVFCHIHERLPMAGSIEVTGTGAAGQ